MSGDPSQVKAVFLKAVEECEPGQWGAFLDAACSGDEELRRQHAAALSAAWLRLEPVQSASPLGKLLEAANPKQPPP